MKPIPLCALMLITCWHVCYAGGGDGVGITSPPCGFGQGPLEVCVFPPPNDCEGNHPNYDPTDLTFSTRIDKDLDLLCSQSFLRFASYDSVQHPGWRVTQAELQVLATQIDGFDNPSNPLGPDYQGKWDVQLIFDYYTHGNDLYGEFGQDSNFRFDNVFLNQNPLESERNHVDLYLVPKFEFEDSQDCIQSIPSGGQECCEVHAGKTPSQYGDDDEDPPLSDAEHCPPGPNQAEFRSNSIQIWDHWGNLHSIPSWDKASTVTFDHEFEHLIQADKYGVELEPGLAEFFATTAEYLADPIYPPDTGELKDDVCYDNTFPVRGVTPGLIPNYQIWRTWGVYLLQHFRNNSGIADDLIRSWNRIGFPRDLRSLPPVLEGSAYDELGCSNCSPGFKGQYRIQTLANRIAVARWVDNPDFESGSTGEGPWGYFHGFDPARDIGIFRKISTSSCNYSHTLPPVHMLGSANLNTLTNVHCYIHPDDPAPCPSAEGECADFSNYFCHKQSTYCLPNQGCGDPIDLYPWGADVVGFVSGTEFMDDTYYELDARFNFGAVSDCHPNPFLTFPCSYRYFVNVVTYNTNDSTSELWDRGEAVTSISTYGPYLASSPRSLRFQIGDFGCPLIRSVAFVISLADSVTIHQDVDWQNHVRLDYSYSYQVKNPNPGPGHDCPSSDPGCPFVYVEGPGGMLMDNDILGEGAWHEGHLPDSPDVTDRYVLSRPVEARDGRLSLELREEATESTSLDAVQLVAYDVPSGMNMVRLLPESRIGFATAQREVGSIRDSNGRDVTAELAMMDAYSVEGNEGTYIEFQWVKASNVDIEIIIVDPLLKEPPGVGSGGSLVGGEEHNGIAMYAQIGQEWVYLAQFIPRERGERQGIVTSAIPGELGEIIPIRLVWHGHHQLDWLAIGRWTEAEGTSLPLTEARHSSRGDVLPRLLSADRNYEMMHPGERINLTFEGYSPSANRQLCLVTKGYYVIPRGLIHEDQGASPNIRVDSDVPSSEAAGSVRARAYPNPSYQAATIEVHLENNERVDVAVYSIDGHLVRQLYAGHLPAGTRQFVWNGRNEVGRSVSSGQYYYRVNSSSWAQSGKLFLIK